MIEMINDFSSYDDIPMAKLDPGMLTQGRQGGYPAPLASRLHRIPTRFRLNCVGSNGSYLPLAPPD